MTDDELRSAYGNNHRVQVVGSDYKFEGSIQCIFIKRSGAIRCVVENDDGVLHVESSKRLALVMRSAVRAYYECASCKSRNVRVTHGYDMQRDQRLTQITCVECGKSKAEPTT